MLMLTGCVPAKIAMLIFLFPQKTWSLSGGFNLVTLLLLDGFNPETLSLRRSQSGIIVSFSATTSSSYSELFLLKEKSIKNLISPI